MTPIAPHLTAFFRERLPVQRGASPHTCDSYAYTFQLLLEFASQRFKVTPSLPRTTRCGAGHGVPGAP